MDLDFGRKGNSVAEHDRNETDFERMQRQATERMREMQRRARPPVNPPHTMPPTPSFVQIPNQHTSEEPQRDTTVHHGPVHRSRTGFDLFRLINFKNLELDSDRVLILGLALLLSSEETDELLMLALLYIML